MSNNFKDEIVEKRSTFAERKRELEKAMKQVAIDCPHQYTGDKAGKGAIKDIGNGQVRCKRCEEEFGSKTHAPDKVFEAVQVLHDVVNQVKLCSQTETEKDKNLIRSLGQLDMQLLEVAGLYNKITTEGLDKNRKKKKNKNKQRSRNDFGGYGTIRFN